MELVPFLKIEESSVNSEEMIRRALDLNAIMGQRHAEYLLEHQSEVPKDFREFSIVFTKAIWSGPFDLHFITTLNYFYGVNEGWSMGFSHLQDHDWLSNARLPRLCS